MFELFDQLIDEPSAQHYQAVQNAAWRETSFRRLFVEFDRIHRLIQNEQLEEADAELLKLQPGCLLSPRLHAYSATIGEKQGDWERARIERFLYRVCLDGVLDTGDGTQHAPFLITHTSDTRDIVNALAIEVVCQEFRSEGGRYDVLTATDGSTYWFDVANLVRPASQRRSAALTY